MVKKTRAKNASLTHFSYTVVSTDQASSLLNRMVSTQKETHHPLTTL